MIKDSVDRLLELCDTIPGLIRSLPDDDFSARPAPNAWSKKEILGHLIDSAANNHNRFVRGQYEDSPAIYYNQDEWVNRQHYSDTSSSDLISLWELYNRHIAHVVSRIPDELLSRTCCSKEGVPATLSFLIGDYVVHMEHHLRDIVAY